MKKIVMLCSVIVALALIVTMFTACGDKPVDETTTTAENQSVSVNESGFTVEIGDVQAIIKKDGNEFQVLKYPNNPNITFDKAYAEAHNDFLDMNFDGQADFYIAVSSVNGEISYYCWLYNATTNQFDYSIVLSALKNISVDAENHRILSSSANGDYSVFSYHWVDGDLVLAEKYDDSAVSDEITKVVEENAIGTDKPATNQSSDSKETTKKSDKPENDKPTGDKPIDSQVTESTTKANKPANTTTTKPYSGGVQLGTGDMDEGWY